MRCLARMAPSVDPEAPKGNPFDSRRSNAAEYVSSAAVTPNVDGATAAAAKSSAAFTAGLGTGGDLEATAAEVAAAAASLALPVPKAWTREPYGLKVAGRLSLGLVLWCWAVSFLLFIAALVSAEGPLDFVAASLDVVCAAAIAYLGAFAAINRGLLSMVLHLLLPVAQLLRRLCSGCCFSCHLRT